MHKIALVAHRGYPARYPENTLIGFEAGVACGARYLEADVQLSRDQVPMLFHDRTLLRVCGLPFSVHELSSSQLKRTPAFEPHRFGERFRGYRPARLSELVALLRRHPEVTGFIEIKPVSLQVFGHQRVVERILRELAGLESQAVLLSANTECLRHAKDLGWRRVAVVLSRWAQQDDPTLGELEPEVLFCNRWKVPLGALFAGGGRALAIYDLTRPEQVRVWAERGATYLETFDIGAMIQGCRSQGLAS